MKQEDDMTKTEERRNGRVGRPTKKTTAITRKLAEAISYGLTDEEAAALCDISSDCLTRWRHDPKFCGAIKKAEAQRLLQRLKHIEKGKPGWQGIAWALERQHPHRFAKPDRDAGKKQDFDPWSIDRTFHLAAMQATQAVSGVV